jgi:vacuolar-type H+-ATPase subunit D/Vma8
MSISIATVTTNVPSGDETQRRVNALSYRAEDLTGYARSGYRLISTVTVPSFEMTVILDTLMREDD